MKEDRHIEIKMVLPLFQFGNIMTFIFLDLVLFSI